MFGEEGGRVGEEGGRVGRGEEGEGGRRDGGGEEDGGWWRRMGDGVGMEGMGRVGNM
jgi:hypothetical protein